MSTEANNLWDDSSLLNAFDNAMSKYKKMHKQERSKVAEKLITETKEQSDVPKEKAKIVNGGDLLDVNGKHGLSTSTDGREVNDPPTSQENPQKDTLVPELLKDTSNGPLLQETLGGYESLQGVSECNQLLNQYYELEEQRQKVLQQLQQIGYWNHQSAGEGSGPCFDWGTCAPEYQNSNQQISHPVLPSACCQYVCHGLAIPCSLMPACPVGEASASQIGIDASPIACTMGGGNLHSVGDDSLVKTAMGAAEKALSSLKLDTSTTSNIHEGGKVEKSLSAETDLSVVLNAWYSAGFHTGKYLTEQSIAKRRND